MLVFKKTSFTCSWNQGILAPLLTTSRTVLYFTGVFMLKGKQLLNKTDTQNFPQKCLFTLRMTRVFLSEWIWWNFYQNFHDHDTRLAWIEKQLIPTGHFILNSESDFAHISTPASMTDSSMNLGNRNKGFLVVPNFP